MGHLWMGKPNQENSQHSHVRDQLSRFLSSSYGHFSPETRGVRPEDPWLESTLVPPVIGTGEGPS